MMRPFGICFQICLVTIVLFAHGLVRAQAPNSGCTQNGGTNRCAPFESLGAVVFSGGSSDPAYGDSLFKDENNIPIKYASESAVKAEVDKVYGPQSCSTSWNIVRDWTSLDVLFPCTNGSFYAYCIPHGNSFTYSALLKEYEYLYYDKSGNLCASTPTKFKVFIHSSQKATCPAGFTPSPEPTILESTICVQTLADYSKTVQPLKNNGCSNAVGNPCNAATGNKYQREVDYRAPNAGGLEFIRHYNSSNGHWSHSYSASILYRPYSNANLSAIVYVYRPDGRRLEFNQGPNNQFIGDPDINDRLIPQYDANNVLLGWKYITADDVTENYDAAGRLQSIRDRAGRTQTLSYTFSPQQQALLTRVKDAFGRQLTFGYDDKGRIIEMTDPVGNVYQYTHDVNNNFASVIYPGNNIRRYLYNEEAYTQNTFLPYALTGIIDENNKRFAVYQYDSQQKAISSEHALGANRVTLNYSVDANGNPKSTDITDALGTTRTYSFVVSSGAARNSGINNPCPTCSNDARIKRYDSQGNLVQKFDHNDVETIYTYDLARNLETRRFEASGALDTAQARTITTEWHSTYRLVTRLAEPNRLTTNTYDDNGNLLSGKIQATTDANGASGFSAIVTGTPRAWSYTYNSNGQVITVSDPKGNVTTNTYDTQGNLISITNAVGHVTTLSNYDANGQVGKIVDPNGLATELTYSPRGWLTSRTVGGERTTYEYDGVGQLTKVTLPDGAVITYTYDDAHRLTDVADSLGNTIHYTLDAIGNRLKEEVTDHGGLLARQITRVYDALNRLQQVTGALQ